MVMAQIATKKILRGKKILISFKKCLIIPVAFTFAKKKSLKAIHPKLSK